MDSMCGRRPGRFPGRHLYDMEVVLMRILLIASAPPSRETAQSILKYTNQRLAPFKRIRRL